MVQYNYSSILNITSQPEHSNLNGRTLDSTGLLVPQAGHSILGPLFPIELFSLDDLGDTRDTGKTSKTLDATIAKTICIGIPRTYTTSDRPPKAITVTNEGKLLLFLVRNKPIAIATHSANTCLLYTSPSPRD